MGVQRNFPSMILHVETFHFMHFKLEHPSTLAYFNSQESRDGSF